MHKIIWAITITSLIVLSPFFQELTLAERAVPDSTLNLPLLVVRDLDIDKIHEKKWEFNAVGTGFIFCSLSACYFVTAKHVLYNPENNQLRLPAIGIVGYSGDPNNSSGFIFDIDLQSINKKGSIKAHSLYDLAVFRMGTCEQKFDKTAEKGRRVKYDPYIFQMGSLRDGESIINAGMDTFKKYDDVSISNDILLFGYPSTIGLKQVPQIDYSQPLLRKGIVSGKNERLKTIIIDTPVYWGNSGSPVIEIEYSGSRKIFKVIGVAIQLVPVVETFGNDSHIANSGYSIVAPMDPVLELIADLEKKPNNLDRQKTEH